MPILWDISKPLNKFLKVFSLQNFHNENLPEHFVETHLLRMLCDLNFELRGQTNNVKKKTALCKLYFCALLLSFTPTFPPLVSQTANFPFTDKISHGRS
jgi:hypothetical protein